MEGGTTGEKIKGERNWWEYRGPAGSSSIRVRWGRESWVARLSSWRMNRKGIKQKKETNYVGVSHCGPRVGAYRLQERLGLVKAIKIFVLHHQEMSSIDDYSFQTDEGAQQSRKKEKSCFLAQFKIGPAHITPFQTLRSVLVTVVGDNILFCCASDGVVMLEQANRPSGIYQQTIIWYRVASFHPSVASICNCQAVEDLSPSEKWCQAVTFKEQ